MNCANNLPQTHILIREESKYIVWSRLLCPFQVTLKIWHCDLTRNIFQLISTWFSKKKSKDRGLECQRQHAVKILSTTENLYSCLTYFITTVLLYYCTSFMKYSFILSPSNKHLNKVQYILHILFYHLKTKLFSQKNLIQRCSIL